MKPAFDWRMACWMIVLGFALPQYGYGQSDSLVLTYQDYLKNII